MGIFAVFDVLASIVAGMDGIAASVTLAQDVAYERRHGADLVGLEIPDSVGWSGRRLRRELAAAGVTLVGLDYRPGGLRFSVPRDQLQTTEDVLNGRKRGR
mgnify:CR=1 FL=1